MTWHSFFGFLNTVIPLPEMFVHIQTSSQGYSLASFSGPPFWSTESDSHQHRSINSDPIDTTLCLLDMHCSCPRTILETTPAYLFLSFLWMSLHGHDVFPFSLLPQPPNQLLTQKRYSTRHVFHIFFLYYSPSYMIYYFIYLNKSCLDDFIDLVTC